MVHRGKRPREESGRVERLTWPPTLPFHVVLARARNLDSTALGMLYKRFLPVVYRYALARVNDMQHAEDVTSETFFTMIEALPGHGPRMS